MANFAQDDFSSEIFDGTGLNTQTDNLGNTWVQGFGSSNAIVVSTATTPHSVNNSGNYSNPWSRNNGTPPGADYTVQADILANGAIASVAGVTGRMSSSAATYYVAYGQNNISLWTLAKVIATVQTNLGTSAQTFVNGTTYPALQLIMSGTTISLAVNGTTLISVTDASISAAGFSGINVNGDSSTSVLLLQNFSAFPNATPPPAVTSYLWAGSAM